MTPRTRRLLLVSVLSIAVAAVVSVVLIEAWVRNSWDETRGTPGFYVSDPVRGQRLRTGYRGWFAGVPVEVNGLGFRDRRDYDLKKGPNTFRILVLGDSVTFGHGAVFDTTYPNLLQLQLTAWKPETDWQVWNLGVPGYNTRNELEYLKEVAPVYAPDLVVVGFFPNDVVANGPAARPGVWARFRSAAASRLRAHVWSIEFYRRVYLTLAWRLTSTDEAKRRLQQLAANDDLSATGGSPADAADQQLTRVDHLTSEEVAAVQCPTGSKAGSQGAQDMQQDPQWPAFVSAVRELHALHASGQVRLVFFLNIAPPKCPDGDFYYDGGIRHVNQAFLDLLGTGVPAVSPLEWFFPLRPSQTPQASGHSLGNANRVKAEVLFAYLRDAVLPALLNRRPVTARPSD